MSTILSEAKFYNINLAKFKTNTANKNDSTSEGEAATKEPEKLPHKTTTSWKKELDKRKIANSELPPEKRKHADVVEHYFWETFYYNFTKYDSQKTQALLAIGKQLRDDIATYGFTTEDNAILAFLQQPYVSNSLIRTKKLNSNNYRGFHAALVRDLIPANELRTENNYNIIYCLDLYNKSAADFLKYIVFQGYTLDIERTSYPERTQLKNRKVLLVTADNKNIPETTDADAKLRTLEEVKLLLDETMTKETKAAEKKAEKEKATAAKSANKRTKNTGSEIKSTSNATKDTPNKDTDTKAFNEKTQQLIGFANQLNIPQNDKANVIRTLAKELGVNITIN